MQTQPNGGGAPDSVRWYVVRVAPQAEFKAADALKRSGLMTLVPVERKWVRRNPRSSHRAKRYFPLFVRYVFVGAQDIARQWSTVRQDPHLYPRVVQGVLGVSVGRVLCLSRAEVDHLAGLSAEIVPYVRSVNPHKGRLAVRVGDKAGIIEGPFLGRTGTVSRIKGGRAHLLLGFFDSMRTVEIPVAALEAIG
jgi:transcription antitermination factor NusG